MPVYISACTQFQHSTLAPVAETGFSHRLTAQKSLNISLEVINRTSGRIIRSKIVFLESMTFQVYARMLSSKVAQSLKCYGYISDRGVRIALSHRHVGFFQESKYINSRPRRGRHGTTFSPRLEARVWCGYAEISSFRPIQRCRIMHTVLQSGCAIIQ